MGGFFRLERPAQMTSPPMMFGYDAIHLRNIPNDGHVVYFYVDGIYANHGDAMAVANGRVLIGISAVGRALAPVVDCEPNCVWPPTNAVAWVRWARANGIDPVVYVGRSNWQAVIAQFQAEHEPEPHWHVAHYTNIPHLCASWCGANYAWGNVGSREAIATQYGGDEYPGFDRNFISPQMVALVDPVRAAEFGNTPISAPTTSEEDFDDMKLIRATDTYDFVAAEMIFSITGLTYQYIGDPEAARALELSAGPPVDMIGADVIRHMQTIDQHRTILFGGLLQPVLDQVKAVLDDVADDASAADVQALKDAWASVQGGAAAPSAPAAPVDLQPVLDKLDAVPAQVGEQIRSMTFGAR
jgi:hypothetical protein